MELLAPLLNRGDIIFIDHTRGDNSQIYNHRDYLVAFKRTRNPRLHWGLRINDLPVAVKPDDRIEVPMGGSVVLPG